jgi:SpoIID/LytB domain protein
VINRRVDLNSASNQDNASHRSGRAKLLFPWLLILTSLALYGIGGGTPSVSAQDSTFSFAGSGWGHAIGMSQWGARGMAANGSSFNEILGWYYRGAAVAPAATINNDLRVLVAQKQNSFTLTTGGSTAFEGIGWAPGAATITATRSGNNIAWSGGLNAVTGPSVDIQLWSAGGPLKVSTPGYSYRYGMLRISIDPAGGLRAVIWGLPMQQYLYGLGEMSSSWPAEALKAQATAGRTFAQKRISVRGSADFDLYGSVLHQSYTGTKYEVANWQNAVNATTNQVITYGGQLIDAVYSASSGGHTENSEFVWVSQVPYLRGVPDPFDTTGGNPNAAWNRAFSGSELGSWFGLGTVTSVQVLGPLGASGRVDKATIRLTGTGGPSGSSRDLTGTAFRSTVNSKVASSRQLMSTKFTVNNSAAPSVPPPAPRNSLPTGSITEAAAEGRRITISGASSDPNGSPLVRVVSTMGSVQAVRDYRSTNGRFSVSWEGSKGTRSVCVTVFDEPTGQGISLGCRDIIVK